MMYDFVGLGPKIVSTEWVDPAYMAREGADRFDPKTEKSTRLNAVVRKTGVSRNGSSPTIQKNAEEWKHLSPNGLRETLTRVQVAEEEQYSTATSGCVAVVVGVECCGWSASGRCSKSR